MADYTPLYSPGQAITLGASATITGGQLVEVTGSKTVGPAAVGSTKRIGVAGNDAASGAKVAVWLGFIVHETATAANVTAGDTLKAGAAGTVRPWVSGTDAADLIVGLAITSATSPAKVQFASR